MRLVVLIFAAACSDIGFDMSYDVPSVTIPGDPTAHASATHVDGATAPFALDIDLSQAAQNQNIPGAISTVTISTLEFSVTSDGCFDFIDDVTLTIESTSPTTTLPSAVIATGASPGCVRAMSLVPTTVDLKPYIQEGATIHATGTGVPPADAVTFDGRVVLHAAL
ncbi:MAG TPA: hypothetical protein VGH87_25230 [Polyangiaceae bacterium]|jgi:hypothetical protein|nr:hypothetical protein [Polyangiaceae bacterium]